VEDELARSEDRPAWAHRIREARSANGWSQAEAIRALQASTDKHLPEQNSLIRMWKRWEAGDSEPDDFYKPLIAKMFGTVTAAFFPRPTRNGSEDYLLSDTGMETLEIISRLRASDVSSSTLDALRVTVDRLCCEYPFADPAQLQVEGREWLRRITELLNRRLTLSQHSEVLNLAGWLALLVGCVEYDLGQKRQAEATRLAALSLGTEADRPDIIGWAHEMRAWYALTQGDLRTAIAAARAGEELAPGRTVSVQLAAQQAKAWARIGDRRQVELALDRGRSVLESLPYPEDLNNHFVVDPAKFDFYAMDAYRIAGEDKLAEMYAREVIRSATLPNGREIKPMRAAEARITLGVIAARGGDLDRALEMGELAISGDRKSLPSLLMVSSELTTLLREQFSSDPLAIEFVEKVQSLGLRES
jgi:tetratricopeptide (TPR) repeat protein